MLLRKYQKMLLKYFTKTNGRNKCVRRQQTSGVADKTEKRKYEIVEQLKYFSFQNTMEFIAIQYLQYSKRQGDTAQQITIQNTIQYNTMQCNATQCKVKYNKINPKNKTKQDIISK